jgi:hypothetical protein
MFRTDALSIIRTFFTVHTAMSYRFTGLLTACEQDQNETAFHPDPVHKLSAKLYDVYHCCVYSEKLPTMDRGTVRNMYSFIPRINLRNLRILLVLIYKF